MAPTVVTCPNCETSFPVDVNATRGKCPSCGIALVFEDVPAEQSPETPRQEPEPAMERQESMQETATQQPDRPSPETVKETVDIDRVEAAVDAIVDRSTRGRPTRAADLAAVESIEPERDYSDIENKVEKLLAKG